MTRDNLDIIQWLDVARLLAETPQVVFGDEAELRGLRRLGVLRTLEYPEHKNCEMCEEYTILQVLSKQVLSTYK